MIGMSWLTALIAVALLAWLLIAFPRFRMITLLVIAGLALLVFLMVRSIGLSHGEAEVVDAEGSYPPPHQELTHF